MDKVPNKVIRQGRRDLWDITIKYRNLVIKEMRNTPRMAGREYKRRSVTHSPSAPFNPPAIDSGNLVAMMKLKKLRDGGKFSSTAGYAGILEGGSKFMQPRPVYSPTIALINDDVDRAMTDGVMRAMSQK
ncbi:hypothetical protein KAR91_01080 [Candidatus Pacearchaeota archaeon]|nr:hypothetical protein [Candidatus Pacearchaeota archaeon]